MNGPFHSARPEELIALRLQLRDNGYHPIPVRGKVPGIAAWQNCTNVSSGTIQQWSRSHRDCTNTGILTGKTVGVDIDVLDDELSEKLVARAFELLGPSSLRRIGRAPKTLLLYRIATSQGKMATPDLFFGDDASNKEAKAKVEILLVGQQVVVHGIHPDTRAPYVWTDRSPFNTPIDEVPLVAPERLQQFVNEADQILRDAGARAAEEIRGNKTNGNHREGAADASQQTNKPSRERVEELLAYIPNDRSYDDWVNIGFAIYDALGVSGCDVWEKWSATSEKNEPDFTAKKWPSFAPEKRSANKRAITYKTLYWEARKNGWREADNESVLNELNEKYFVTKEGGKTWVVTFELEHKRLILTYMKFGDFTNLYMNRLVRVEAKNKTPQYIPLGRWWLQHPQRRQYDGLIFEPGNPAPTIDNRFNLWRGWGVEAKPGDWSLMREHIRLVLASGDPERFEYIMRWLAWAVQNPGRQAEVALVFKGKRGTGKGTLGNCMLTLFGQHSRHVSSAKHLAGNFNAHLRDTCFLFGDECYWPGDKQAEGTLKRLLTEPTLLIEAKGRDAVTVPNHLHVLLSSNEDWVVPAGENERRFFMSHVSEVKMQNEHWFKAIDDQLKSGGCEAMLFDLMNYKLDDWHPRRVPQANGLISQQARSLPPLDSWWVELLETGTLVGTDPNGDPGRAVSNKYEEKVVVNISDRWVVRPGLYDQARSIEPRLRSHTSDHQFGAYLKERGCSNAKKVMRRQGWTFPPLSKCREDWEKRFPGWQWRAPNIRDWRSEEGEDEWED